MPKLIAAGDLCCMPSTSTANCQIKTKCPKKSSQVNTDSAAHPYLHGYFINWAKQATDSDPPTAPKSLVHCMSIG